jgi:beta-1,4-N-acetylglucosaminyltransferase
MIFVTVGSTEFDALVEQVDRLAPRLDEQVISQIGLGRYRPTHCDHFRFAPSLDEQFRRARLIIGHGGLGTAMEVIRLGRPFVGVSNPDRPDAHQDEILAKLEAGGHLVWCRSLDALAESIDRAGKLLFSPYVEPECRIPALIARSLSTRLSRRRTNTMDW